MPQADISLTYQHNGGLDKKWTAFLKFDCPIFGDSGNVVNFAVAEASTFGDALDTLRNSPTVQRYFQLLEDNEEGAEQNARIN